MKNLIFQNSYFPSRVLPSLGKFPGCATVHRPPCNCGSVLCLEFRGIQCLVVQVMLQSCRNVIVFINDWKQLIHSCMFNIFCNPLQISLQNFDHTLIMYFLFQEEKTDAGLKKKTLPLECIFEATLKGKKKDRESGGNRNLTDDKNDSFKRHCQMSLNHLFNIYFPNGTKIPQ